MDQAGRSELHYAALENEPDRVVALIQEGADPNRQDKQGFTPLHFAAQQGSLDAAQKLVELGAHVDVRNKFGKTPLSMAVYSSSGEGELIQLLRDAGADPCAASDAGQTPVGLARLIDNVDVARFFADLPDDVCD